VTAAAAPVRDRHGFSENEADDLVQQTFLAAIENRQRYDVTRPLKGNILNPV